MIDGENGENKYEERTDNVCIVVTLILLPD